MKYGNEENLLDKLFNYLDQTKDEKLEFTLIFSDSERYKKRSFLLGGENLAALSTEDNISSRFRQED